MGICGVGDIGMDGSEGRTSRGSDGAGIGTRFDPGQGEGSGEIEGHRSNRSGGRRGGCGEESFEELLEAVGIDDPAHLSGRMHRELGDTDIDGDDAETG